MFLAQCNLGWMRYPLDDPGMTGFREAVIRINELADASPGFVWRHTGPDGHAMNERIWDDPRILYNGSVWESVESLWHYVFKSAHLEFYQKRREWFTVPPVPPAVMWWVAEDARPSIEESLTKLRRLEMFGSTAAHFTFQNAFQQDGAAMSRGWQRA